MNKRMCLRFLIICFICLALVNKGAYASPNNEPPSFEEKFIQAGYTSVEEAVEECEHYFKQKLKLPRIKPSISFTHQFGQFWADEKYQMNDHLNIYFAHEQSPENNYTMDVRPLKNKVDFTKRVYTGNQKGYKLADGQEAIYVVDQLFHFLIFEKGDWQYMLGIDKRVSNKETPNMLVEIADSID